MPAVGRPSNRDHPVKRTLGFACAKELASMLIIENQKPPPSDSLGRGSGRLQLRSAPSEVDRPAFHEGHHGAVAATAACSKYPEAVCRPFFEVRQFDGSAQK